MKIGIIGSGNIGGNLGKHWASAGYEVLFSSRHPEELKSLVKAAGNNSKAMSTTDVFESNADVYVLAIPFKAIDTIAELYAGEYADTVILDATNPYPDRDGEMAEYVREANYNASEYIAMKFGTSRTAKAFNTIQAQHLKDKAFKAEDQLAVPYAAQDEKSKSVTKQLIEAIGFDPVFIGDLTDTKVMDPEGELYGISVTRKELLKLLEKKRWY